MKSDRQFHIICVLLLFLSPSFIARKRPSQLLLINADLNDDLLTGQAQVYTFYGEFTQNQAKCAGIDTDEELNCFGFNSWSQFKTALNETYTAHLTDLYLVQDLDIKPSEEIVLTGELDLRQVCEILWKNNSKPVGLFVDIAGLKGVEVVSGWTDKPSNTTTYSLKIFMSTLDFYYMGSAPGQYQCNYETMISNLTKAGSFLNQFNRVEFESTVKYDQNNPVCPFLFINAQISELIMRGLVDSFLVSNLFKSQLVNNSLGTINSTIYALDLHGYNYALDESMLHRLVFERIYSLNLLGMVGSIQPALFKKSFGLLTDINVGVACLANFFHQVGLEWTGYLSNLNSNIWIHFHERDEQGFNKWLMSGFGYAYPNHDLCIFSRFAFFQPQQKQENGSFALVVPQIHLNSTTTGCTDSAAWLTHNVLSDMNFIGDLPIAYDICWNASSYHPNISAIRVKINQCLSLSNGSFNPAKKEQADYQIYTDYYQIVFIFQISIDILAFVLIPFACIVGLLLNARVVWTVLKKGKSDLNEEFYKYMTLNSIFNCLFCFIYAFYPINSCLRYEKGYFCSAIYNSMGAQVFKIVFVGYVGEVCKMCSNISYILITINRYMLVGKEHSFIFETISKWTIKHVIIATVCFSLLINIGHCFQYRINFGWGEVLAPYELNQLAIDIYPSIVVFNSSFQVYSIVYFVFNFVVFFLINMCAEASLVLNMRTEIAEKRKKVEKEITVSAANNSSDSEVVNKVIMSKQKKIAEDAKKETKAIKMVVANSLVNFFLRLPEILVFFSSNSSFLNLIIFEIQTVFLPMYMYLFNNMSATMVDISYLCYILTFTTNVVINCLFNKKLKKLFSW